MSEPYVLQFSDRAVASLKRLDKPVARRILDKLSWLATNATMVTHTSLTGEWSGFYRLRVGNYRVIYQMDHGIHLIVIEVIGHRREIYAE
jgi:mRNA interferase RelE/StbE